MERGSSPAHDDHVGSNYALIPGGLADLTTDARRNNAMLPEQSGGTPRARELVLAPRFLSRVVSSPGVEGPEVCGQSSCNKNDAPCQKGGGDEFGSVRRDGTRRVP
jgi:hypothetical protein